MAAQDLWAAPLAKQLVDLFRCETLVFVRKGASAYDPNTGTVTQGETLRVSNAGAVLNSERVEDGGVGADQQLECWVNHPDVPWPVDNTDALEYLGKVWRITSVDPTYSGDVVYASKLTARAQ